MSRYILDESKIHPNIQSTVKNSFRNDVEEVIAIVENTPVVVIGMAGNPHCKKACKVLDKQGTTYRYVEYGSYFKEWRKRNALKMWTGWKTFPMVFVDGMLIGGAAELQRLVDTDDFTVNSAS